MDQMLVQVLAQVQCRLNKSELKNIDNLAILSEIIWMTKTKDDYEILTELNNELNDLNELSDLHELNEVTLLSEQSFEHLTGFCLSDLYTKENR